MFTQWKLGMLRGWQTTGTAACLQDVDLPSTTAAIQLLELLLYREQVLKFPAFETVPAAGFGKNPLLRLLLFL